MIGTAPREYSHTPIQCGIDWITATAKAGRASLSFEELADQQIQQSRDAGRDVSAASRLGYQGWTTGPFYFGRRTEDSIIVVSGPSASGLALPIIQAASNVSRIDLQVTVWTHGEQPNLAAENFRKLRVARRQSHRPGQVSLTTTHPQGDTLNVNKRSSDSYGRLYDKAAEAECAPSRTVWRYEVEYKRRKAMAVASGCSAAVSLADFARDQVHAWFSAKGVEPTFTRSNKHRLDELILPEVKNDILDWYERSVSRSIARAIKRHGLTAVLDSLGLSSLVQPITKGGRSCA